MAAELRELGCRRTGTNYLEVVLEENFDVDVYAYEAGWKHGLLVDDGGRFDGYVITVKDPYSWLVSIEKFYGTNPPQQLWRWVERVHDAEFHFAKTRGVLLEMYFAKYAYWLQAVDDRPAKVVRYEDLLEAFEETLTGIADAFDLEPRSDDLVDVDVRVGAARTDAERRLGGSFDPTYYTEKRYLDEYGSGEIERVADYIEDKGFEPLLSRLGYDLTP